MNEITVYDAGDRLVLKSYKSMVNVFLTKDEEITVDNVSLIDLTNAEQVYVFEPVVVGEDVHASFIPTRTGVVVKSLLNRTVYICEKVGSLYMWKDTRNMMLKDELESGNYKILDLGD